MSKFLTLGNGSTLVGFDGRGQIKDFYFPRVGLENHIGRGSLHRVGVWADGDFRWFEESSWNIGVGCELESLVGSVVAENLELGVRITFSDVVYNELNIFMRRAMVENLRDTDRVIKIFFGQEFQIYESATAHTAYFDPALHALIHYKGQRVFLVNAQCGGNTPFDEYTTGIRGIWGKEGSFKDAEEGILSKNAIEHGPADSVIGCSMRVKANASAVVHHWIAAGRSVKEVEELNRYVLERSPDHLITTTRDFWHAWIHRRSFQFYGLTEEAIALFHKSLLVNRIHTDKGGAVIASADSDILHQGKDTYAYMWPRDGAIATIALYQSGSYSPAKRFFEFCNSIIREEGYFMHKYSADGSLGSSWHPFIRDGEPSLPIQEDETALVLFSLWQYYELSRDLEFIEEIYNTLIKRAALFLLHYRDERSGLPHPSYDLWEERFGVHTFTAASVYGALTVAAKFADLLGKHDDALKYNDAALEVKEGILKHCYDAGDGIFYRSISREGDAYRVDRTIDASSAYGVFRFGVLEPTDERLMRAMKRVENTLTPTTHIGGITRYENDAYFRTGPDAQSNPWFITTCWLAQYDIAKAKNDDELNSARARIEWCVEHAGASRNMSEQVNPYTGAPVSVAPLVWSHAEYTITVLDYLKRLEELGICDTCRPLP